MSITPDLKFSHPISVVYSVQSKNVYFKANAQETNY